MTVIVKLPRSSADGLQPSQATGDKSFNKAVDLCKVVLHHGGWEITIKLGLGRGKGIHRPHKSITFIALVLHPDTAWHLSRRQHVGVLAILLIRIEVTASAGKYISTGKLECACINFWLI
jgi:hypothetical protein